MTKTIGIIPAGGKAERFGGIMKELLPINNRYCGLTRCIETMIYGGADEIIISTNDDRYPDHARAISGYPEKVNLIKADYVGLWELIADIGSRTADRYFFAMPDTIFQLNIFNEMKDCPVLCGTFTTYQPERFGVFIDNSIIDKTELPLSRGGFTAWGVWSLNSHAMKCLVFEMKATKDHTKAFNNLFKVYDPKKIKMPYYYDFASFEDYKEYLCKL